MVNQPYPKDFPTELDAYEILERLGTGGFAFVHKARTPDGRIVALKVPRIADMEETLDEGIAKDFLREAELWSRLTSSGVAGVVKIYAYGQTPYPWMALEYMESGTLEKYLGKCELDFALEIAIKLLDTLHHAHHLGVIHRDLKPRNILFDAQGNPKISDWGLGKVLLDATTKATGAFKGSVAYAAPEQYSRKKFGKVDWHTDVFQTGAVLYHLFSGKPPLPDDPMEAMACASEGDIIPLKEVKLDIPEHISKAIMKALSPRKEDRWDDASTFKQALLGKSTVVISSTTATRSRVSTDDTEVHTTHRGTWPERCEICGNLITADNKLLKCKKCGKFFCKTCEGWIDKVTEYKGLDVHLPYPLCEECYRTELQKEKERIEREVEEEKRHIRKKAKEEKRRRTEAVEWFKKGDALDDRGRYKEAIECYDRALEIDPQFNKTWNNKGIALDDLGRYEEAIECYDRALEIDPQYKWAWNNKGLALDHLVSYEEAIKYYDRALAIDPNFNTARQNRKLAKEKAVKQKGLMGRLFGG